MKKAFKMIFIYLGVLLLALIATVVFCAGFLFFYREGNIFGIQYISTDNVIYARESEDMSDLKTIEVHSENFKVLIEAHSSVEGLIGAMNNEVFGYAKKAKAHTSFSLEYNEDTKTAVFSSSQPKGWLNKKKAFIQIAIPEDLLDNDINLIVKTSKADINIGGNELLVLGSLTIETSKGDATVSNVQLSNGITTIIGSGSVYIDETCKTTSAINASVEVGSGTINFAKINVEEFSFGVIEIKSIKRGKIGIIKTNELITNGNINGGGRIEVGEVGVVDFESLDTDILIGTINGVPGSNAALSIITINGQGDVFIDTAKSDLEVNGHNGNININIVNGTAVLMSNQGDVRVGSAIKAISVDTTYGNADITFAESDAIYTAENGIKSISATTKNGHIIIKGLQHGIVTATDKGRISLEYDKVVGENKIVANSGVVNIVVPDPDVDSRENEYAFNLNISSEVNCDIKVGVVGHLGGIDYSDSGNKEFSNIYNSGTSTLNNLDVSSTTGRIKIRSTNLIGF